MADSWGPICGHCLDVLADVPASILLATVLATAVGLFVLVSRSLRAFAPTARRPRYSMIGPNEVS